MSETSKMNDTIVQMVNNLKTTGPTAISEPSLKRSLSSSPSLSSSLEEATPTKKFKRQSNFNLSYVASPRETNRLRFDLLEARNIIADLENRIQHMHHVRKQMQLMYDNETESLKRRHDYDRKTIEQLEDQLQTIRQRETALKLELSEMRAKYDQIKVTSEEELMALTKELGDQKDQSQNKISDNSREIYDLKQKLAEMENVLVAAQDDAKTQKELVKELSKELKEKNAAVIELEMKKVELIQVKNQLRSLESAKEDYLEYQQQSKLHAKKLNKFIEMEKENAQLKEDFARLKTNLKNKLLLEEEVHNLKIRVEDHKKLEQRLFELQSQFDRNQAYLNEWKAVARGFCESNDNDAVLPHLLRSSIERLQHQELSLLSEKVEFETQIKTAQHEAKVAKAELEKCQKLIDELKTTGTQKQTLIHRMQKKLQLVSRERDSYRLQLDSYERDLTMIGESGTSIIVQSQKERIDNLEKIVGNYRDLVEKLENDLQEAHPQLYTDVVTIKQEQTARLQQEVAKLRDEKEQLLEQRDRLEIQLESLTTGQDTLHGGQAFHLAINPLAECLKERQQQLESLQEENLKLKNKIRKMEQGLETSKLGEISICPQEVQSLREQVKNNEKQTQKLKDYFKSSIQDFRNVVYMMFGYKIDRPTNSNVYILRNMYAEQPEQLHFQVNADGGLDLMENEYSMTLGHLIGVFLIRQKSIPAFLSTITLELFNQRTATQTY
ncbi:hypothetical protein ABEB36_006483 [Hypothenemus hampei]|uniref:Uncharacterized protein n=1 Tax=Hypothenemus hampei TaxID=57062 RepID=A0ABD1ER56_HYPHA